MPLVSLIPVVHLDLQISLQIFEIIRNDPDIISRDILPLKGCSVEVKGAASAVCLLDSFVARGRFVCVPFQKQDANVPFSVPCKCLQSVSTLKKVRRTFVRSFKKYLPYNEKSTVEILC